MLNRIPFMENSRSAQRGVDQPSKGVFVGDLSSFCAEKDLYDLFAPFGRISAIEIKRGRHGDSLLHGFVEYESDQAAAAAIEAMNGYKYRGRRMRVNKTNMKLPPVPEAETWVQVQVHFVTKNINMQVCEEFLEASFAHIGKILDVIVKRHLICTDPPQISGYGFVFFEDMNAAVRAIATMKGVTVEGVHFDCQFGTPKREDRKHTFHGPSFGVVTPQLLQQMQQQAQVQAQAHLPAASINFNNQSYTSNSNMNNNNTNISYHHQHPGTSYPTSQLSLQPPHNGNHNNSLFSSGLLPAPLTIPTTSNVSSTTSSTVSTPHHVASPHLLQHHVSPSHLKTNATNSPSNAIYQTNNNNLNNNIINVNNNNRSLPISHPQHLPAQDFVSTSPRAPSQPLTNQQQYLGSEASMMWKPSSVAVPPTLQPPQHAPQPRIYSNNITMANNHHHNMNNSNIIQSGNVHSFQKEFLMEKEFVAHLNTNNMSNNNNGPASAHDGTFRERVSSMDILPSPPLPTYPHHVNNNSTQISNINNNVNNNMVLSERLLALSRSEDWLSEAMSPSLNMDARLPPSLNSASRSNINYAHGSSMPIEEHSNNNNINNVTMNSANKSSLFSLMARSHSSEDPHQQHLNSNNNNAILMAKGLSLASLTMSRDEFISPVPSSTSFSQINTPNTQSSHNQQLPSMNTMELSSLSSSSFCSVFSSSNSNNNTNNMRYLHNSHHTNHPMMSPSSSSSSTPSTFHRPHNHPNMHNNTNVNHNIHHQGFLLASSSSGLQSPSVCTTAATENDILLSSFSQGASFSRSFSSSYDKWHTPSSLSSTSRTVYMNSGANHAMNVTVNNVNNTGDHSVNNHSLNKNNIYITNDHFLEESTHQHISRFEDKNVQEAWHQQRDRALFVLTPSPEPWMKDEQEQEDATTAKEESMVNHSTEIYGDNPKNEQLDIEGDFGSLALGMGFGISESREEDANNNNSNQSLNAPPGLMPSIAMSSYANLNALVHPTANQSIIESSSDNSPIHKPHAVSAQTPLQEHYFMVQPAEDN